MKVIYIAGPYRAATAYQRQRNIDTARDRSLDVWKLGAAALCPHTNTAHFDGELPDDTFLDGTMELMRRCDAVLLAEGDWMRSAGTRAEVAEAERLGLPVLLTLEDLAFWLNAQDGYGAGV